MNDFTFHFVAPAVARRLVRVLGSSRVRDGAALADAIEALALRRHDVVVSALDLRAGFTGESGC